MTNIRAERLALPLLVAVVAWWFLLNGAGIAQPISGARAMSDMPEMSGMPGMSATPAPWATVGMWVAMMAAMMLPGAMPWIAAQGAPFAVGYLMVWTTFGAGASLVEWELDRAGALSGTMALNGTTIAAVVVSAVGFYELTPFKSACLRHCSRGTARDAVPGARIRTAVGTGLRQGLFCLGCCWALMALMFVAGVMNVVAMLALTAFIALEKLMPARAQLPRVAGAALLLGAVVLGLHIGT
jgi:predicted metal-binding membrane protein